MSFPSHTLRSLALTSSAFAALLAWTAPADARVTKIVIDDQQPLTAATGQTIQYKQISGRAFGELNPEDPLNAIIQDIELGKDPDGKVRYVASWVLTLPVDASAISGLMWHDVPNRGSPLTIGVQERNFGDVGLASAWQGDNSAINAANGTAVRPTELVGGRHFVQVPVARNRDGSAVTGLVFGRIVNRSGPGAQALIVQTNPVPYLPASLDTTKATLVSREHETMEGVVTGEVAIPSTEWKFCGGGTFAAPLPLTALPVQICLNGGFDPTKLYQVVYTAKDPYVLGAGFAAWRDVGSFFKYAAADDVGTPNPVAGRITWSIGRGVSQSGNFLRGWLHLGFNQDEARRQVHDGMWPIIAGRRIALNFRWAQPDGVLELYQAGSEGPQWWGDYPDHVRHLPRRGILDRCRESHTCPKIIEHFGSAEVWALKLTPEWVGTDAKKDIPLPKNVRRYYIPSTTHGGGGGGFDTSLPGVGLPTVGAGCPGNNYGTGIFPANPVPHTETQNALRVHFRNWVMQGTLPPPSLWPRLDPDEMANDDDDDGDGHGHKGDGDDKGEGHDGHHKHRPDLVEANKAAMGFPTIPGLRPTAPESDFINPVLDYDWGPDFDPSDASGVPTNVPPPIKRVIKMLVPRVDADGNEIGGVPVVLRDAPLGTYLGWNITDGRGSPPLAQFRPFHKDQLCDYVGGMIPFAETKAERLANGDPRLSLEERYKDHAGYVAAVTAAAANAVAKGFLLQEDASALITKAQASAVLNP
ncbi:MAG TPA: alpha/beta hydrolase domain-containing protein [Burkholderiales bacterium]|nr:alpha/beta hydrolase domain-containing protein [Burkholderiales bacterium]